MQCPKKSTPLIEFLEAITLKIKLKRVIFSGHPVYKKKIKLGKNVNLSFFFQWDIISGCENWVTQKFS